MLVNYTNGLVNNLQDNHEAKPAASTAKDKDTKPNPNRYSGYVLAGAFVLCLIVVIVLVTVLGPTYPLFILEDVTVRSFNASAGTPLVTLTSHLDATISAGNPSRIHAIGYHGLRAYVEYQSQWITAPEVPLSPPDLYQSTASHRSTATWTPSFAGDAVRVSPALLQDLNAGVVNVTIHVKGRVRGIIGALKSAPWSLDVRCRASLPFGKLGAGVPVPGGGLKFALGKPCFNRG
ncbi:Protein YLS [Trema orientale]|uniref:Protein YLS n=1 Tax=Trema orientale TaxID=63057 RepID=A0A2P5EE32_TREOI|nr:Protein YLS [Trema orientale]